MLVRQAIPTLSTTGKSGSETISTTRDRKGCIIWTFHEFKRWARQQRAPISLVILCVVLITDLLFAISRIWQSQKKLRRHPMPVSAFRLPAPLTVALGDVLQFPLSSGNPHRAEIALTFDDGPDPIYTPQILLILQQHGVTATFNVIGANASVHPEILTQESRLGFSIGNHTWTHPELIYLTAASIRAQLLSSSHEILADTGTQPTLFRPPYGKINRSVQAIATSLGLSTIMWNIDPKDWSKPGTDVIIRRVLSAAHNGSIILLHDGGGNRSQTVAALPTIITTLKQRGFHFVTIPDMIDNLPYKGTGPDRNVSVSAYSE